MKASLRSKWLVIGSALLGLSYLGAPEGRRGLASVCVNCLERPEPVAIDLDKFPIPQGLFAHVQDQEVKKSAEDYYRLLTQIEINSLLQQQKARAAYGLQGPLFASPAPITVAQFTPNKPVSYVAESGVWGSFLANPQLGKMFPGSVMAPGSLAAPAQFPRAPTEALVMGASPQLLRNKF